MEINWFYVLVAGAGVLLAAVVSIGLSARRAGRELERERKRSAEEATEIRSAVTALQSQLAEVEKSAKKTAVTAEPAVRTFVPAPALTADQRAGALEMLRRGADAGTVCGALRLSQPQTALLQKVQRLVDSTSSAN